MINKQPMVVTQVLFNDSPSVFVNLISFLANGISRPAASGPVLVLVGIYFSAFISSKV
jgi:hypothetical protein